MKRGSLSPIVLLLGSLTLFASWLAPGHYFPWINFQNELLAALSGLLLGAAVLLTLDKPMRWPTASTAVLAVAIVPIVQLGFGQIAFLSDGVMTLLYLCGLAASIAVGASVSEFGRREFLDGVFGALLAAGLVSTGIAAVQWLGLGPFGYIAWVPAGTRPIANVAQPNHLASLFALALIGALWLYETRRINGNVLWLVAVWLTMGMAMTRSRMIWVAAAVFALGWLILRKRAVTRLSFRALAMWLAVFCAAILIWGPLSEGIGTVAPLSVAERVQGGGGRWRIWSTLVDGLLQSPWVGYGWSQVSRAGLAGSLDHYTGESMLRNSHSLLLDLLIWNGLPLGVLIIAALAWWWWRQLGNCDTVERGMVLGVVGVVSVHALVEYPLEYAYFLVLTGLLVGALEGWSSNVQTVRIPRSAMAALIGGLTISVAWVAVEYVQVEEASRENRMLASGYARTASLPALVLLDEPIEYMRFWRTEAKVGMASEELAWMRKVAERNPAPATLLRYAAATGLNGQPAIATQTLLRLCNMHQAVRCDEGRKSWAQLQQTFPTLQAVAFPQTPVGS